MERLYLVTGAAGYLGGELCRQLVERGDKVRALVLPGDKMAQYIPAGIEQVEGDLCDTAALEHFFAVNSSVETIVVHCASMIALGDERHDLVMKVNVQGTQNMIDACLRHPECRKMVYVGSTGAIPELPHGQKMTEPDRFGTATLIGVYAQSKALASQAVLDAVHDRGLNACIVMPSGILGPGDYACSAITTSMINQVKKSGPVSVAGTFNLCDVRDLANGILLAVEKGKAGESYILGNEVITYKEFNALIAEEGHCGKPSVYLPKWLANLMADQMVKKAEKTGTRPLLTRYEIYNLTRNNAYDTTKAKQELGYTTRPCRETIRDEIEWLHKIGKI